LRLLAELTGTIENDQEPDFEWHLRWHIPYAIPSEPSIPSPMRADVDGIEEL
jgi:hypothetical protein